MSSTVKPQFHVGDHVETTVEYKKSLGSARNKYLHGVIESIVTRGLNDFAVFFYKDDQYEICFDWLQVSPRHPSRLSRRVSALTSAATFWLYFLLTMVLLLEFAWQHTELTRLRNDVDAIQTIQVKP